MHRAKREITASLRKEGLLPVDRWSIILVAQGDPTVVLPADGHVHSEWSWDAENGSMEQTCARAVAMGLPAVAFTEHADYTPWTVPPGGHDAPLRYWPHEAGTFDPSTFQEEFRHALHVLADSGRALEINTTGPLHPEIATWWHEEGGTAVTFGSDAHEPAGIAHRFTEAAAMVEASGFQPGRHPHDYWRRTN
jgi:histidinol phosphatase-like PHP family hydrolase